MGLLGKAAPSEARKKWKYLKKKYKVSKLIGTSLDCKCKGASAETWPWFALMDEVLGQRHSTNPPILLTSFPEDTSGPSSAVDDENEEEPRSPPAKRKRGHVDELVELLREDINFQREVEERRAQESRERMDRLFSLIERMVNK
ncbi:hypothetical protein PO909_013130 [Leuciscus waleckii]